MNFKMQLLNVSLFHVLGSVKSNSYIFKCHLLTPMEHISSFLTQFPYKERIRCSLLNHTSTISVFTKLLHASGETRVFQITKHRNARHSIWWKLDGKQRVIQQKYKQTMIMSFPLAPEGISVTLWIFHFAWEHHKGVSAFACLYLFYGNFTPHFSSAYINSISYEYQKKPFVKMDSIPIRFPFIYS